MKFFLAMAILALSGCIALPLPPGGPDSGKLGRLELKLVYTPNINGTISYFLARQQKLTPK